MTKGPVVITTFVECGMEFEEEVVEVDRDEWDRMTPGERQELCIDMAATHQNNFAPCGWDIKDAEDQASTQTTHGE